MVIIQILIDLFEERKKVLYYVCIKSSITIQEDEYFLADVIPQNEKGSLLIKGRWQSRARFQVIDLDKDAGVVLKVQAEPPPVKSLAQQLQEKQKIKGEIYTCSYAIRLNDGSIKFHVNDVCHARIRPLERDFPKEVSLMVQAHLDKLNGSKEYIRAVDYILNRSPWASVFSNKDYTNNFGCVDMDTSRGVNEVAAAAIALRTCSEFSANNITFCALVDAGVNEHVAYIVAHLCTSERVGNFGGGHHVIHNVVGTQSIVSFFKTGKWITPGVAFNGEYSRYFVIEPMMSCPIDSKLSIGYYLRSVAKNVKGLKQYIDRWEGAYHAWYHPNNLIPLAQQFEKEHFDV